VKEPPVFAQTQQNLAAVGKKAGFLEIFSPSMLRTTILTCLLMVVKGLVQLDYSVIRFSLSCQQLYELRGGHSIERHVYVWAQSSGSVRF
jgi:hypothetical protein